LENYGLIRKGKQITLSGTPLANSLKFLAGKYRLDALLEGRRLSLLLALVKPKGLVELSRELELSESRLLVLVGELMETGALRESEGKYYLNGEAAGFFQELKKVIDSKGIEANAVLLFSNGFKLKRAPLSAELRGSRTAFSLFPGFGVGYASVYSYWIEPAREVSAEEALVHALAAMDNKKELALCMVFFIKNRAAMSLAKIKELARRFGVLRLFLDCLAFIDKRESKPGLFLPRKEFESLAGLYGVNLKRYARHELGKLEELLYSIGGSLGGELDVFLIGGCNLALRKIKGATKDIDLIVREKSDFEELKGTLLKMGFKQVLATNGKTPSGIFEKENSPRIDCFTKTVMGFLSLTKPLANSAELKKYGKLNVWLLSPEAIVLFKSITERAGDLEDIIAVIKKEKIGWASFFRELEEQQENIEQLLCLNVLDSLELAEERAGIKLPVKKKIVSLCLEHTILFLCEEKALSVKEMRKKMDFPEYKIRNTLSRLLREKKIRRIEGKPVKFAVK